VTTIPRGRVTRIGKTWAFVIDIPSADGRRRQRKRGGFATQREATAEFDQLRSSLYGGTFSQRHSLTLEEYLLDTWMPAKISQGLRPGTLHSYRSHLARPIKLLGHVGLQDVTPLQLDELYRLMSTDGLSPRTIRYTHGLLLQAFAYAQRKGFASRNVAALADPPSAKLSAADHRPQAWDASQCRAFLEATTRDRLAALWHLFLATGARRGELLALRWADVDLETAEVRISRSRTTVGYEVSEQPPKTAAGLRTIAIASQVLAALDRHRRQQLEERLIAGPPWNETNHVFTNEIGQPLHPDWISKRFREISDATELPRIRLHDLRHSSATLLLDAGLSPRVVADRLGHADPALVLRVYGHTLARADERAANALGTALGAALERL
jgi:integrase